MKSGDGDQDDEPHIARNVMMGLMIAAGASRRTPPRLY